MRRLLVGFFNSFRSDAFSFIAGAVFAILVNLSTQRANISGARLWLILGALLASTGGFVSLSVVLKFAEEEASNAPDPKHQRLVNVNNRLRVLCFALVVALGPLVAIIMLFF